MAFTVVLEDEIMKLLDAEAEAHGRRRLPHLREILRERYGLNLNLKKTNELPARRRPARRKRGTKNA